MLRITTLEQGPQQEVHEVRNLGAVALAPVLLGTVAMIVWNLGSGEVTGEAVAASVGLALLSALVVAVMAVSLRAVEVTVQPDRIVFRQGMLAAGFSAISYRSLTRIGDGESILLDPVRTGSSAYSVVTSTDRVVAKRVPSRRMARQLAQFLDTSLARLRGVDS